MLALVDVGVVAQIIVARDVVARDKVARVEVEVAAFSATLSARGISFQGDGIK